MKADKQKNPVNDDYLETLTSSPADHEAPLKQVLEKIHEIMEATSNGDYLYRGEPQDYEKISSGLYREYEKDIETENFDIEFVQGEILKNARDHLRGNSATTDNDEDLLALLQHYGGKTNLIDFTNDYLIALFFACDGLHDKPGRVICLRKTDNVKTLRPDKPSNRVIIQKSIFVCPPAGFIDDSYVEIEIPKELKSDILDYLRKYHDISTRTMYNDLHGFIRTQGIHKSAYTEFYKGLSLADKADKSGDPEEKKKLYEKAIKCYDAASQFDRKFFTAYFNCGVAKSALEQYAEAIDDYTRAISINPNFVEAYFNRGFAKAALKQYTEAIDDYTRAISINPDDAEAWNNRGNVRNTLGRHDEAVEDFTQSIKIKPDFAEAYAGRGRAKAELGQYAEAIEDYTQVININPNIAEAYNNRGLAKNSLGQHAEAIDDYTRAISINPDYGEAYNNRGAAKYDPGEYTQAVKDFTQAIRINPDNASAHANCGLVHKKSGNFPEARRDLETALRLATDQNDQPFIKTIRQALADLPPDDQPDDSSPDK